MLKLAIISLSPTDNLPYNKYMLCLLVGAMVQYARHQTIVKLIYECECVEERFIVMPAAINWESNQWVTFNAALTGDVGNFDWMVQQKMMTGKSVGKDLCMTIFVPVPRAVLGDSSTVYFLLSLIWLTGHFLPSHYEQIFHLRCSVHRFNFRPPLQSLIPSNTSLLWRSSWVQSPCCIQMWSRCALPWNTKRCWTNE